MKKFTAFILVVALLSTAVFAGGQSDNSGVIKMKFGNTQNDKEPQSMALMEVAKRLNESGMFDVTVHLNSSLGATDDLTEQGIQGAAVLTVSDPGRMANYVEDFGVIQMPYMFEDSSVLNKLVETETYKGWEKEFEEYGVKLVTSNWFSGARNMVLSKAVDTPADLKGQRIRTIGSPIFTESINAMGAVATPMEWAEVYPGIQQKALDGAEVQSSASYPSRIYEVCTTTNKTEHFQLIGCVVMGADVFNSWPQEAQDLFVKTFKDVGQEYQAVVNQLTEEYEQKMRDEGMDVREVNKQPFIDAVQPVYEKLGYTELKEQIFAELAK